MNCQLSHYRISEFFAVGHNKLLSRRSQQEILHCHSNPDVKPMLDAVIAVITNGEKILFILRAPNIRGGGHWAPVSGEVEPGESQEAAVAREAMEEVGLTVRPIRKVWENVKLG